jgi:hypothetical protein
MPSFVPRFRITAAVVASVIVLLTAAVLVVVTTTVPRTDPLGDLTLLGVGGLLVAVEAFAAITSVRRALALRRVTLDHPDGLVFLARRQPAIVSDLAEYLRAHDITADVADRWVIALVDDRGISAWGLGSHPEQLLLMTWDEIGPIEVTDLDSGAKDRGVAVLVRPSTDPLVASIGYAAFGLTASVGRDAVAEITAKTNALRP